MTAQKWFLTLIGSCFVLILGAHLDGPSEIQAMRDTQADAREAAQASREYVAQTVCGPNGTGEWIADKELRCVMKNGRKTKPMAVEVAGR